MTKASKARIDVYQTVTDKLLASLEQGVKPWLKPWKGKATDFLGALPIRSNGKPYQGINVWLLWCSAAEHGYSNNQWMTFNQAKALGGCVRKGERGSIIVKWLAVEKQDATGAKIKGTLAYMVPLTYCVFNVEQIDGLPENFYPAPDPAVVIESGVVRLQRIDDIEQYFTAIGADVRTGKTGAFYNRHSDFIGMPNFDLFASAEDYYSTKAHEFGHWTGHESRLDRQFGTRFGDDAYAAEELVAEMTSAFLCAFHGIELKERADHASYLAHWIKILKADKKAIFTASSAAQKAAEFLHSRAGVKAAPEVEDADIKEAA